MRLKELRKSKKLRQSDVAAAISCSQAVYSRYESGEREPSAETLKALADYFGVTVDYLLGRDGGGPKWIAVENAVNEAGVQPNEAQADPVIVRAVVDVSGSMRQGKSIATDEELLLQLLTKKLRKLSPEQRKKADEHIDLLLLEQQIKDFFPKPDKK